MEIPGGFQYFYHKVFEIGINLTCSRRMEIINVNFEKLEKLTIV